MFQIFRVQIKDCLGKTNEIRFHSTYRNGEELGKEVFEEVVLSACHNLKH